MLKPATARAWLAEGGRYSLTSAIRPRLGRISFRDDESAVPRLLGAGLVRILLPNGANQLGAAERRPRALVFRRGASEDPDPGKMWQAEREAPVALQL